LPASAADRGQSACSGLRSFVADQVRDWEQGVALADLVGFVDGDLKLWQGRLAEGLRLQQQEGSKLDAAITRNLAWLGFGAE
jgi:hypothetical protein